MSISPLPVCVSCCAELCGLHGAQHGLQIQLLNSVGQFTFYPEDICSLSYQKIWIMMSYPLLSTPRGHALSWMDPLFPPPSILLL
ncbi:hypothetical protein CesoFtcFv8_008980 [Champsocephalus esox]|uniref:Uncharacterized protein n=1 Tax=Champsocephalus esox TaxID=159716 RepID=A0AAN8C9C5_9TELE|nr:hypothetical protein CesoFtcFv8_008980 [Champsocephalus esox]